MAEEMTVSPTLKSESRGSTPTSYEVSCTDGNSYEGEWAEGKMHGKGTFTWADGAVDVVCFEADAPVGQAVRWSADRTEAWELQDGEEVRGIPLDEAAQIAERIGLPPP